MDRKLSRRCALGALLSLVVYGLACVYPAAWSPDSKKVVFPVFTDELRLVRLVMTDLCCERIRQVARVTEDGSTLGPASWSPDGRWIAYMRFTEPANPGEEDAPAPDWELHVQDAVTGDDRTVLKVQPEGAEETELGAPVAWPPAWIGSDTLAVLRPESGDLTLVNRQGEILRTVDLPDRELAANTAVLSPDGKHVAWMDRLGEKNIALFVRAMADADEEPDTFELTTSDVSDDSVFLRPAWSGEGRFLYFADARGHLEDRGEALVRCLDVEARHVETVCSRKGAGVMGIGVSGDTGLLVLDCKLDTEPDETTTIEILDPQTGQSTVVHASNEDVSHVGTAISPDGRWVAFCPALEEEAFIGAIVSADGGDIRFFVPEGAPDGAVADVVRERVETSLELLKVKEALEDAGIEESEALDPERLPAALEVLDRLTADTDSALYRETLDYARVMLHLSVLEDLSADERDDFEPRARAALDRFEERYPGHPLLPELRNELEAALRKSEEPEEGGA